MFKGKIILEREVLGALFHVHSSEIDDSITDTFHKFDENSKKQVVKFLGKDVFESITSTDGEIYGVAIDIKQCADNTNNGEWVNYYKRINSQLEVDNFKGLVILAYVHGDREFVDNPTIDIDGNITYEYVDDFDLCIYPVNRAGVKEPMTDANGNITAVKVITSKFIEDNFIG